MLSSKDLCCGVFDVLSENFFLTYQNYRQVWFIQIGPSYRIISASAFVSDSNSLLTFVSSADVTF